MDNKDFQQDCAFSQSWFSVRANKRTKRVIVRIAADQDMENDLSGDEAGRLGDAVAEAVKHIGARAQDRADLSSRTMLASAPAGPMPLNDILSVSHCRSETGVTRVASLIGQNVVSLRFETRAMALTKDSAVLFSLSLHRHGHDAALPLPHGYFVLPPERGINMDLPGKVKTLVREFLESEREGPQR